MAIVQAPPTVRTVAPQPGDARDTGIDLLRALCVVGVVLLHAIMVGVTITDGVPVFDNASVGTWWIVPLSWALQVMPLFFVIGGFSGMLAYRRSRQRGGTARSFVATRVHRLLRPAIVTVAIVGAVLLLLGMLGIPAELIVVAGFRYGQPLWFLAVFLLCQALLPALVAAHERAPMRTLTVLVSAAMAVDAVRGLTGIDALGFANLAFVWLAVQQIGFFLADGRIDALSRRVRIAAGLTAVAVLLVAFATGVYSPDLIENINPPTAALLLVAVVHTSALSLHRERLSALSRRPRAAAFRAFVTPRTMTIYLWHMPVLLAMAGTTAIVALSQGSELPAVDSIEWWFGRPVWLVTALGCTALVALIFSRIEQAPSPELARSSWRVALSTLSGLVGIVLLLAFGTSVLTATLSVALLALALHLASREAAPLVARRRRARTAQTRGASAA